MKTEEFFLHWLEQTITDAEMENVRFPTYLPAGSVTVHLNRQEDALVNDKILKFTTIHRITLINRNLHAAESVKLLRIILNNDKIT